MSSDTPRTDAIKKLIRDAINEPDRERQIAMREGAECGIEQLERDLAAAQSENAKLKAHAEAMAEEIANQYGSGRNVLSVALDAYRRDFPKDAP